MKRLCVVLSIWSVLCAAGIGYGDLKPTVSVTFRIPKQGYRDDFPGTIAKIEADCTERMIGTLSEELGFLHFAGSGGSCALEITLDDKEPNSSHTMQETGFRVSIRGEQIRVDVNDIYWTFRDDQICHLGLGEPNEFVAEVCNAFKQRLAKQRSLVVASHLRNIALTKDVLAFREQLKWVLPFTRAGSGIDYESRFDVRVLFVGVAWDDHKKYGLTASTDYKLNDVEERFQKGLMADTSVQDPNDPLKGDREMHVEGLYIVKYVPYRERQPDDEEEPEKEDQTHSPGEL